MQKESFIKGRGGVEIFYPARSSGRPVTEKQKRKI